MIGELASDNSLCGGESASDVLGLQQIDDMLHNPVNDFDEHRVMYRITIQ